MTGEVFCVCGAKYGSVDKHAVGCQFHTPEETEEVTFEVYGKTYTARILKRLITPHAQETAS